MSLTLRCLRPCTRIPSRSSRLASSAYSRFYSAAKSLAQPDAESLVAQDEHPKELWPRFKPQGNALDCKELKNKYARIARAETLSKENVTIRGMPLGIIPGIDGFAHAFKEEFGQSV